MKSNFQVSYPWDAEPTLPSLDKSNVALKILQGSEV